MGWPEEYRREIVEEVGSTSEELRHRATLGEPGGLWLAARRQTAGRGRRGKVWTAPHGNLSASLLLRPEIPPREAALYSFVACLAVADMLDAVAPGSEVALKWPNDALLNGRKTAGVLLESEGGPNAVRWLVIGIGVNLAAAPVLDDPDAWTATSVATECGAAPDTDRALELLATGFARYARQFEANGFLPIRAAWLARAARLGEIVTARLPSGDVTGVFADVDGEGAIVLDTPNGERRIAAAEIHFPERGRPCC
jgi:BirA family biotin operon repressor/biotin-[acetyl-CoA-carboxylase] ligase